MLTGDSGVGKTALFRKFHQPDEEWTQSEHITTIGVDFIRKIVKVEGKNIMLNVWDTAG